jgi:NAD+ kinase
MDNLYIIINENKDKESEITKVICEYLENRGKKATLAHLDVTGYLIKEKIPAGIDVALVLGGDGTIIRAARELAEHEIPILGINLGTLGYLAEVEVCDFRKALDRLFSGRLTIEQRMMLQGSINERMENTAINDIVVARDGGLRIVNFDVYVNGVLLNNYTADGLIVSTPTGSTGYNLSAGGPIVEPTANIVVMTPICSHSLNTRSIVLSSDDVIEVEVGKERYGNIERMLATFDGSEPVSMKTGDRLVIKKSKKVSKFIKIRSESFLKTMQTKMKGN